MQIFYCVLTILLSALLGYLFGSIPNAVIIGKVFFKRDPRNEGSKNAGGTNAGRIFGLKIGVIVIILDMLKVAIPFAITFFLFTKVAFFREILYYSKEFNVFGRGNTLLQLAYWITPFAGVIGHCYSLFIKFSGGKAVSSYMGFAIASSWVGFITVSLTFFPMIKIKKKVSIASLVTTSTFTVVAWIMYIVYIATGCNPSIINWIMYFGYGPEMCIYFPIFITLSFLLLTFKHKPNIKRIKEGTEPNAYWLKDEDKKAQ